MKLKIKQVCADKGITQAELATMINITAQSLSRIVSSNTTSDETLQKIAKALDVTVSDLIENEPSPYAASIKFISDTSKIEIAKIINIVAPTAHGIMKIGSIIYRRPLTDEYKMKPSKTDIQDYLGEYPAQSSYPNDSLDLLILRAIQDIYPDSFVRNKLIVLNVDINYIDTLESYPTTQAIIDLNPLVDYDKLLYGKRIEYVQFRFPINIYTEFKIETLRTLFSVSYDPSMENTINETSKKIRFS